MDSLVFATAHQLAAAIAAGTVSSLEVVEAHLAQLARHGAHVNAVVTLDGERARARAQKADEARARGESWGPLHGVPFTIKDTFCTLGLRTTAGVPDFADYLPARDATVVARLRAAGGVLLGKTNVPPMAGQPQCNNPIFGCTNNPWDLARTPGGSSGGSCAAVAAGMSPLDIGSDMAGSIRIPAHFCGVYGLKPSARRVSGEGHIPGPPGAPRVDRHLATPGPLARSVRDLALGLRIIAGADGVDSELVPLPWLTVATPEPAALRIAFAPTLPGVPVAAEIRDAVATAARALEAAGACVDERLPSADFAKHREIWQRYFAAALHAMRAVWNVPFLGPPNDPAPGLADWVRVLHERDQVIADWEALFDDWDVFVCPVVAVTAFAHCPPGTPLDVDGTQVESWRVDHFLYPFNFTGHPAVVIPMTRDGNGLPIGLQLVGRRFADERLLAAAECIDGVLGGFRRPPGFD